MIGKENQPGNPQIKDPPNVILEILKSGYLHDAPIYGKYYKKNGIKDASIIEWLFNNYPDTGKELTADIYVEYIYTENKPQTIGQYICRAKGEAEIKST